MRIGVVDRCVLAAGLLVSAVAMGAYECHWTGAVNSQWNEAGNWAENRLPEAGDTVVFGEIASGTSSTVTVDGGTCLILRISGAKAPAYNFVGESASSVLTLNNHGYFQVDSSVVNDQTFTCKFDCVFSSNNTDTFAFTNASASAKLTLHAVRLSNAGAANFYFGGIGAIEMTGQGSEYAPNCIHVYNGNLHFAGNGANVSWRPKSWDFPKLTDNLQQRIYIADGAEGLRAVDGGGGALKIQALWQEDAIVDGRGGVVPARTDSTGYPYLHNVNGNVTVTFRSVLAARDVSSNPRLQHAVGFTRYPDGGTWADRVVVLEGTNTFDGPLMLSGNVIVKAAKFGARNCAPTDSNIGCGHEVMFLRSGATLEYVGAGETCDRDFHYHQGAERWTWNASFWDKPYTLACIRNAGTGPLTLTGEVNAQEAPEDDATGALNGYPTNCLFRLDGATAPIVFQGTAGGSHKFAFEAVGDVALKTFPASFTNLMLASANVTIDAAIGNGALTIPELFVTNSSSLKLPSGYSLRLGKLRLNPNRTLDLVMDDSVTVMIADVAEGLLENVTINGATAHCDAAGRVLSPGTAWSSAADGRWSDVSKWTAGVPSASVPGRVNLNGVFTIAVDTDETIGDFSAGAGEGKVTMEVSGKVASVSGSRFALGSGSELRVTEDGEVTLDAPSRFVVNNGGKLNVAGGKVRVVNAAAYDLFSSSGTQSAIETAGGSFFLQAPNSAGCLQTGAGFAFGGSGGQLSLCGSGNWYQKIYSGTGNDTNRFSGTAEFAVSNKSSLAFCSNGRYEFSDDSRMFISPHNAQNCFKPVSDGNTLEFTFRDRAALGTYDTRNNGLLVAGCPDAAMPNGVTRFVFDSDADHYLRGIAAGVERTSLGEIVQRRGVVHLSIEGLSMGTFWEAYYLNQAANCGVYRMQGGVLDIASGGTLDCKYNFFGLLVGWSMLDGYPDGTHTIFTNYRNRARFELDDGWVTNRVGIVAVGCGRADGELVQRGGKLVLGTSWAASREATPEDKGASAYPGLYLVGGFSGTGIWAISNGVTECASSHEHTYVGGVDIDTVRAHTRRVAQGSSNGSDVLTSYAKDDGKTATGLLEVVDGTMTSRGDLIVGARGHGEVRLVGATGTVSFRNLVMSNNVASVARFVFDANGVKPIVCTGSAAIAPGAQIVVDFSNFTGHRNRHPLIVPAGGMTGSFAETEIVFVGDSRIARLAMFQQDANGAQIVIQRGMTINLR